jgi:hypothetical protein
MPSGKELDILQLEGHTAFHRYIIGVQETGESKGLIVGAKKDGSSPIYIYNQLGSDFYVGGPNVPNFERFHELRGDLEEAVGADNVYVAHVTPTHKKEVLARCERNGVDVTEVTFGQPIS